MQFAPIVALDVHNKTAANEILNQLPKTPRPIIKIGMELYYSEGPAIVKFVQSKGFEIFLDLKLHDIPHTVEQAMQVIGSLGIKMTTIHAAGGSEMLKAGLRGLQTGAKKAGFNVATPYLLAVTQLTSIDEQILHEEQHVDLTLAESVQHYALLAQNCGLSGVICSGQEVTLIREVVNDDFLCVTPGIRPSRTQNNDQKRVVTPRQARQLGANGIVVGRPITQAKDPRMAYIEIAKQFMEE
ncbi:orotidine-5'-phosphate decarboxylase [Paucilactobacillus sp. N302-9]